ncbi:hypothetical protein ACWDUX_24200 [Streptomyces sp. NPDC003444]
MSSCHSGCWRRPATSPRTELVAFSSGDGHIVLRGAEDAIRELIEKKHP